MVQENIVEEIPMCKLELSIINLVKLIPIFLCNHFQTEFFFPLLVQIT